jgi:hypothetical protein
MFVGKCWLHERYLKGVHHITSTVDLVFIINLLVAKHQSIVKCDEKTFNKSSKYK